MIDITEKLCNIHNYIEDAKDFSTRADRKNPEAQQIFYLGAISKSLLAMNEQYSLIIDILREKEYRCYQHNSEGNDEYKFNPAL